MARPTIWTSEIEAELLARLKLGVKRNDLFDDEAVLDRATFYRRMARDPEFKREVQTAEAMGRALRPSAAVFVATHPTPPPTRPLLDCE